jgi:hypothetical protein
MERESYRNNNSRAGCLLKDKKILDFSNQTFNGESFNFLSNKNFSELIINFKGSKFINCTIFVEGSNMEELNFEDAEFKESSIKFSNGFQVDRLIFLNSKFFDSNIKISSEEIKEKICFTSAEFKNKKRKNSLEFEFNIKGLKDTIVYLEHAEFENANLNIRNNKFFNRFSIKGAKFNNSICDLIGSTFEETFFSGLECDENSDFIIYNATFNKNVDFYYSRFHGRFSSAAINLGTKENTIESCSFDNVMFKDEINFSNSIINCKNILFTNTIFEEKVNFNKIELMNKNTKISFEKAKINRIDLTEIKNIKNLKELSFYGAIFENTPLIKNDYRCVVNLINSNVKDLEIKDITSHIEPDKEDRQSIIKLRKLAEEAGDIDTGVRLGGIEISLRKGKRNGFMNGIYEGLSKKGKSISLPLIWLMIFDFIFSFVYAFSLAIQLKAFTIFGSLWMKIVGFTLINNIPFVAILRNPNKDYFKEFYPNTEHCLINGISQLCGGFADKGLLVIPTFDSVLIFFHLMISFGLVFLIGLGIRNRFRLK